MPRPAFTLIIDDRQEKAFRKKLTPAAIEKVLAEAAEIGAKAGVAVLRPAAPKGKDSPSQYYRRQRLPHGTFRATIRSALIKRPDFNTFGTVRGYVLGPMGKNAFTRAWREFGTRPHGYRRRGGQHPGARATHWLDRASGRAFAAATKASEVVLEKYVG